MEGSLRNPFFVDFSISVDDDTVCYFTDVTLEAVLNEDIEGVTYEWDFGVDADPPTATGIGPHVVQYATTGSKTVSVTAFYESTETVEETIITVSSCPGSIVGTIFSDLAVALSGITVRLYEDFDENGIVDGAPVRTVSSNVSGVWVMASVPPGHYIATVLNNITVISVTDDGTAGLDPIDTFTIVPDYPSVGQESFSIEVRTGLVNGFINIIATQP